MEGRRKRQSTAAAAPSGDQTERPLRRDVDRRRAEVGNQPVDLAGVRQRQPDLRVRRAWKREKTIRGKKGRPVPEEFELLSQRIQCSDDAVDLREPSVADNEDAHSPFPTGDFPVT
jgi:hypothetical protein